MPAHAAVAGKVVRTGKRAPRHDQRTLLLARYLIADTLPKPPTVVPVPPVKAWPMYANDSLGDCTIATAGHMIQAWTTDAGKPRTPTEQAIVNAYWATGDPPGTGKDDNGRWELDVLNYWRRVGIAGRKIRAYAAVDISNAAHVKLAVYLFGGAYIGLSLPITAQRQTLWHVVTASGDDAEPGSWGGHAVNIAGYDRGGLYCVTWGKVVKMTWPFFRTYCDEGYALISPELFDVQGRSPEGFDLPALSADLHRITV